MVKNDADRERCLHRYKVDIWFTRKNSLTTNTTYSNSKVFVLLPHYGISLEQYFDRHSGILILCVFCGIINSDPSQPLLRVHYFVLNNLVLQLEDHL